MTLKATKPQPFPANPKTLGQHLRKRRHERGFLQRQVAQKLGVTVDTVVDWEADRVAPEVRYWPKIIAFIGYDPTPNPTTLGDRLKARYRALGLPRKTVAHRLGVDENTLQRYEAGTWKPTSKRARRLIARFLAASQ